MTSYQKLQHTNELLKDNIRELTRQLMIISIDSESAETRYIKSFYRLKYREEHALWHGDAGEFKSYGLSKQIK
jgi:hypothetical protein